LLVPITGIERRTVIIGLAIYSLTILVRALLDGLASVPSEVRESGLGMGYGAGRMLLRVEFPLALPTIIAGLRVATVSTVALTTVGAILDAGGLGQLILQGTATDFKAQVLAAGVLCVALAIVLDLVLVLVQRLLTPWTRRTKAIAG
jgi:osmoprotectant transport system permease protein